MYENLWKCQILLCKYGSISMETSDTFTKGEMDLSFQTLQELTEKEQK